MKKIIELLKEDLNSIDKRLNSFIDVENDVFFSLKNFLNSPTKRIRSILALLYFKCFKKEISEDFIKILTCGELIHNASLLHDDVIDEADYRREQITLNKKFSPHVSILCGDYLLSSAIKEISDLHNWDIVSIFESCTRKMSEAEILQYCLRNTAPDLNTYINICYGKTASLFEAILSSCSIILKTDKNEAQELGKLFGILFQLKNDLNKTSAEADKKNKIFTPKDFLGIEKTNVLIDNYKEEIKNIITKMPNNIYKKSLEDLLNLL